MPHPQPNVDPPKPEASVIQGGSLPPEQLAASLGIVRHVTETYSVGGFKYTSLTDAVAQARRMIKLERELL